MRLACIANGNNIHALRWVNYFARKGHEVHLICFIAMAGYHENVRIHLLVGGSPGKRALARYLRFLLWICQARRLIKRIKPDILESLYVTTWGFIGACSGFHPFSLCAQGSDILIDPRQNLLKRWLVKYALKKADMILYDSETLKKGVLELGTDVEKTQMILNGVDTRKFSPQRKSQVLREKWQMVGAPLVICFREFKPVYNVEMVIKAIPLMLSQLPEVKFIIASDGELRINLESLVDSLGIRDAVLFPRFLAYDDVPAYLASSDVYVSTSLSDSTSLCLQEAMACGLAPVVTDLPANREWITDGENGFIVPINDVPALADRVVYLLRNDEVRKSFGRRGREIIQARAEYREEMGKLEKLYAAMIR